MVRPVMSVPPPAENGTMIEMGFSGYSAKAGPASVPRAAAAPTARDRNVFMGRSFS